MILTGRRSDGQLCYSEPFQAAAGTKLWFVTESDTMKFVRTDTPLEGVLLTEEQFNEQYFLPEN